MEGSTLFEWADRLKALRDRKEALEAELKQVNVDIDDADWHLSNLMAESETQNFTRAGTMFCLTTKTRANAAPGRKDELFDALRAEGYGDMITETVNAKRWWMRPFVPGYLKRQQRRYMNDLRRELLKQAGQPRPEGGHST